MMNWQPNWYQNPMGADMYCKWDQQDAVSLPPTSNDFLFSNAAGSPYLFSNATGAQFDLSL